MSEMARARSPISSRREGRRGTRTSRLIFGFRYLINYISTFTTLVPGDVIVTFREWIVPTLGQRSRDPLQRPDDCAGKEKREEDGKTD